MTIPKARDMFSTNDPVQLAERFEDFKETLNKSLASPRPWGPGGPLDVPQQTGMEMISKGLGSADVSKSLSAETIESIRTQLATADAQKDLTLTSPISTGLVAFDLEAPSKKLFPKETKLRNRIPRKPGIGTSHRFKVISGISGTSSAAGAPDVYPGISDSTTTQFGSINYLRGPKISYAGYDVAVPYSQFSLSDQVPWSAQFSGEGYEDYRQLSQTSVLWASMLMEEKMIISGRGTGSGFLGALTAPTGVSLTARAATGTEAAITGGGTNIYVKITADAGTFGQSVLSSSATVATGSGVVDVNAPTLPAGAIGYRVYVGTGASLPADSALWYAGRSNGGKFTIQGALPTSGTAASTVTADTSAYAAGYDGIIATCLGPNSGYVKNISSVSNGATSAVLGGLNVANPGAEFFVAFDVMYQKNGADPDEILCNGSDRRQLSDLLKTSSSSNYRITVQNDSEVHDAQVGALVTGLQNEVTGKMVSLSINRFMPQGVMPIISWTLPIPDSNVSDVWEMRLVQEYMGIQWPVSQFAYECSSYWYGSLICPAPAWNGAVTGVAMV